MFKQTITKTYNLEFVTFEILIMLLVAFILGYLFCHVSKSKNTTFPSGDLQDLEHQNKSLKAKLNNWSTERDALKKSLIVDYSLKIDKLKSKLSTTRMDLEKCLSSKADKALASAQPKKARKAK